jgi:hypothetical protein
VGGSAINISLCLAGAPAPREALPIGFTRPGASQQRQRIVAERTNGRGAAFYWRLGSAQGRANRDNFEASVVRSEGYASRALIPIRARSRPIPRAPHARPGPFSPNASGATSGAVLSAAIGATPVGWLGTLERGYRRPAPREVTMTSDFGVTRAPTWHIGESTSKNSPQRSLTTKLPSNDSGLFPLRFADVHSRRVRDRHWNQFFEVPVSRWWKADGGRLKSNRPPLTESGRAGFL